MAKKLKNKHISAKAERACINPGKENHNKKEDFQRARRELFYLWLFLAQEGIYEEARDFINEHMEKPVLFWEDI